MMIRENWNLKTHRKLKIKENFRKLEKMTKLVKTKLYQRRYTGITSEKKLMRKQKWRKKLKKKQLYYINEGKGMMTKKRKRETSKKLQVEKTYNNYTKPMRVHRNDH